MTGFGLHGYPARQGPVHHGDMLVWVLISRVAGADNQWHRPGVLGHSNEPPDRRVFTSHAGRLHNNVYLSKSRPVNRPSWLTSDDHDTRTQSELALVNQQ